MRALLLLCLPLLLIAGEPAPTVATGGLPTLLETPISPVCKPDCQGLCMECGQNLNEKDCGHKPLEPDSPFAKLKDLL